MNKQPNSIIILLPLLLIIAGCQQTIPTTITNDSPILVTPPVTLSDTNNDTVPVPHYYVKDNSSTIIFLPGSSVIVTPLRDVIVVGAGSTAELALLNEVLSENNITRINYLVLPTPVDDASSYLAIRYQPFIYYTGFPSNYETFKKYSNYSAIDSRLVLNTDVFVEILPPYKDRGLFPNINDNSLVVRVVDGNNKFLLLNTCSTLCQQSIAESADVLQTSTNDFNLDFLTRTRPTIVANPRNLSINQINYLGITTHSSEKIYAYSDGTNLEVNS